MSTSTHFPADNPTPTLTDRVPPHAFFLVSAVFHYLGPSFAVLLFAHIAPSGVAWLRIASAGLVFAVWRRPWRFFAALPRRDRIVIMSLGITLAAMNVAFYEAIARLPLATVGAIEFLGPILVAATGARTWRNAAALVLAITGVYVLTDVRIVSETLGYVFAFTNCVLFVLYILLGHRIASSGSGTSGIDRLGAAMLIASVAEGGAANLRVLQRLDAATAGKVGAALRRRLRNDGEVEACAGEGRDRVRVVVDRRHTAHLQVAPVRVRVDAEV